MKYLSGNTANGFVTYNERNKCVNILRTNHACNITPICYDIVVMYDFMLQHVSIRTTILFVPFVLLNIYQFVGNFSHFAG